MGILLFILAIILVILLFPVGIIIGLIYAFWQVQIGTGIKRVDYKFFIMATVIDVYGNVVCAEMLNKLLIHKDSPYKFGNPNETISICMGRNIREGLLIEKGEKLRKLLNRFDPNHCEQALSNYINNIKKSLENEYRFNSPS